MKIRIELLLKLVALGLMAVFCVSSISGHANALSATLNTPTAVPDRKSDLKLKVVDKSTKRPIKNTVIEIYSDNGIRCVQAPCPTNGKEWHGKTNSKGVVFIPENLIQNSMTITAPGYSRGKELNRDAKKLGRRSWIILLDPD